MRACCDSEARHSEAPEKPPLQKKKKMIENENENEKKRKKKKKITVSDTFSIEDLAFAGALDVQSPPMQMTSSSAAVRRSEIWLATARPNHDSR